MTRAVVVKGAGKAGAAAKRAGAQARGADLASVDELDERQLASWMKQATAIPGSGGEKR